MEQTRADNDAVIDLAASSAKRFYPVVSVHPADGKAALAELERVAKRGARQIKLHPNTQDFDVAIRRSRPCCRSVVRSDWSC
jgi:predicted TIM-barrel fold metal-dependent hydrolase